MTELALGKWRVTVDLEIVEHTGEEPGPRLAAAVRERLETIFGVTGVEHVVAVALRRRQGYSGNAGPYDDRRCPISDKEES